MTDASEPGPPLRGRVLDWAWNHPRSKRRMREAWGVGREAAAALKLPRPFDPPEWKALRSIAATAAEPVANAERVLFMSWRGWSTHLAIETVLAHAVLQRGGAPIFAYCGGRLPICDVMPVDAAPPMPCHSCREYASGAIHAAGFDSVALHDVIDVGTSVRIARKRVAGLTTVAECEAYVDQGLTLGRLVRVSVAWFLSRGTLPDIPEVVSTYRSFLVSGIVVARGLRAILTSTDAQRVFMLNGTFFAESIMSALAVERGLPFETYEKGFIRDSIVMTSEAPASQLKMPAAAWGSARDTPLTDEEARAVEAYLLSRRSGGGALDNFWRERVEDVERIRRDQRLVAGRPLVVMFCNILWDSAVLGRDIAFASMGDWVLQRHRLGCVTSGAGPRDPPPPCRGGAPQSSNPRAHGRSHQRTRRILPSNVRVVEAGDPTSSYAFMDEASLGLVYTSTVGLELACTGVPVIVAADTHYRGRGFTVDPATASEYWLAADRLMSTPPDGDERARLRERARRYAALFFFRFHNVLAAVTEDGRSRPRIRVSDAKDLDAGNDPALDRLVAGILYGTSVVAPASLSSATKWSSRRSHCASLIVCGVAHHGATRPSGHLTTAPQRVTRPLRIGQAFATTTRRTTPVRRDSSAAAGFRAWWAHCRSSRCWRWARTAGATCR